MTKQIEMVSISAAIQRLIAAADDLATSPSDDQILEAHGPTGAAAVYIIRSIQLILSEVQSEGGSSSAQRIELHQKLVVMYQTILSGVDATPDLAH